MTAVAENELASILADLTKRLPVDGWPSQLVRALTLISSKLTMLEVVRGAVEGDPHLHTIAAHLSSMADAMSATTQSVDTVLTGLTDDALPSRWARVNMMGHVSHVGEVQHLAAGALLIHAIDLRGDEGVYRRYVTADRSGRHSVEWLTEDEWRSHVADLERRHATEVEHHRRATSMPDGYELVKNTRGDIGPPHGFRCPAGVNGFFWSICDARSAAWEHADDPQPFQDRAIIADQAMSWSRKAPGWAASRVPSEVDQPSATSDDPGGPEGTP